MFFDQNIPGLFVPVSDGVDKQRKNHKHTYWTDWIGQSSEIQNCLIVTQDGSNISSGLSLFYPWFVFGLSLCIFIPIDSKSRNRLFQKFKHCGASMVKVALLPSNKFDLINMYCFLDKLKENLVIGQVFSRFAFCLENSMHYEQWHIWCIYIFWENSLSLHHASPSKHLTNLGLSILSKSTCM